MFFHRGTYTEGSLALHPFVPFVFWLGKIHVFGDGLSANISGLYESSNLAFVGFADVVGRNDCGISWSKLNALPVCKLYRAKNTKCEWVTGAGCNRIWFSTDHLRGLIFMKLGTKRYCFHFAARRGHEVTGRVARPISSLVGDYFCCSNTFSPPVDQLKTKTETHCSF